MPDTLCLTVRFLQPWSHARRESGDPEWPPSPLRLFQALVAAAATRSSDRRQLQFGRTALEWLQQLRCVQIVAPSATVASAPYRLYVPDNIGDKVANSWRLGNDADIANYRTEKDVYCVHLDADALHYLYPISDPPPDVTRHVDILRSVARSIAHLGWGIDMVIGNAELLSDEEAAGLPGERWQPDAARIGTPLRVPVRGTLDALVHRHQRFLNRLSDNGFRPVPPLTAFEVVHYRRYGDPARRPFRVFRLVNPDEGQPGVRPFSYPQEKLIHIAGMVRHLAIATMKVERPRDTTEEWVDTYVAGHVRHGTSEHHRFSYVPLPSIGHPHTDPAIRRVMITAPHGDEHWLDFLTTRLSSRQLQPEPGTRLDPLPVLQRERSTAVVRRYTGEAATWASVTPVILSGHDDHKPAKTRKLIETALRQSGIEQPCEFEWRSISWFPKSCSAHKYDRAKREIEYIRPSYLKSYTGVHMRITFKDRPFPGPLVIGAGRHCGFGLFASLPDVAR